MNTITLVAYNRPSYTAKVLNALIKCHNIWEYFDRLIISVDAGSNHVFDLCASAAEDISSMGILETHVYRNAVNVGVAGNPYLALQRAFEEHRSDFNLAIEDDALLMPDVCRLASWFQREHGGPLSQYFLMSLCNHNEYKTGLPHEIFEATYNTAPFAYCMSKYQWHIAKAHWNAKQIPPTGWDYSMSMAMSFLRLRCLHPTLSRCKNIGREGGVHETPETFDRTQSDISYSDGSYSGDYKVEAFLSAGRVRETPSWAVQDRVQLWGGKK